MKYKLKLKGRTDKKNLTVNIGGESFQVPTEELFKTGVDVTDVITSGRVFAKELSVEKQKAEKIKVNNQYFDYIDINEFAERNYSNNKISSFEEKSSLSVEIIDDWEMSKDVPFIPSYKNLYNNTSNMARINDTIIIAETSSFLYSFNGGKSWFRSRDIPESILSNINTSSHVVSCNDKFYIIDTNRNLWEVSEDISTKTNILTADDIAVTNYDFYYVRDNILFSRYKGWRRQLEDYREILCIPSIDNCYILGNGYFYDTNANKKFEVKDTINYFNFGKYIIFGKEIDKFSVYDTDSYTLKHFIFEDYIWHGLVTYGYDYKENKIVVIHRGNLFTEDGSAGIDKVKTYDFETNTLTDRASIEGNLCSYTTLNFKDKCFFLRYSRTDDTQTIYDMDFNIMCEVNSFYESYFIPYSFKYNNASHYYFYNRGKKSVCLKEEKYISVSDPNKYIYIGPAVETLDKALLLIEDPDYDFSQATIEYLQSLSSPHIAEDNYDDYSYHEIVFCNTNLHITSVLGSAGKPLGTRYTRCKLIKSYDVNLTYTNLELYKIDVVSLYDCNYITDKGNIPSYGIIIHFNMLTQP